MLRSIGVVIGVLGTAVAVARADGVGNEVTVGSTEGAGRTPKKGFVSDRLWGSVDVRDVLTVRAEGSFTRDVVAADGWTFADDGMSTFRLAASVDIYPSEHVAIGLEGTVTPATGTSSRTSVELQRVGGDTTVPGYADVYSWSSTWGVTGDVEYDSAGDSRFEWVAGAAVGVQTFNSFYRLDQLSTESGMILGGDWNVETCDADGCDGMTLTDAKDGKSASLQQVRLSTNGLATIYTDTDVGVTASYYLYTSDPTELGLFSLGAVARDQVLGEGLHYAPVELSAKPSVTHRIGRVQLGSWFEYARYVGDEGDAFALGLRVQVRVGAFRVWLGGVGQQERGPGDSPRSAQASLGARVRF
jgi:hypothetical protein